MPSGSDPGIVEHEPGDLTCIVDGGLRLSTLQAALTRHGQRFSLDPPGDPTLADCLLHDLSGPLRHRFGTMRDLVIGVGVVLPDGTRAHSGGKVVKNVAGYDLGKLYCGSAGKLGTVERLALRLHPRPAAAATIGVGAGRWDELHRSGLVPSAVDVVAERMYVLFEGAPQAVAEQAAAFGGGARRAVGRGARPASWAAWAAPAGTATPRLSCGQALGSPMSWRRSRRPGARSPNASWRLCAARS